MMSATYHIPALLKESIDMLEINPSGVYADATLGGGGHTRELLSRLGPEGRLIVFDQDADALANAPKDKRVTPIRANFRFIHNCLRYAGYPQVDGILADLGVSFHQFDTPERGFSFRFDAPLDMRMNAEAGTDAATIINSYEEQQLECLLRNYGELDSSRRAASLICQARQQSPIRTTFQLNSALETIIPAVAPHKFLAKVYQALRMEVNAETRNLEMLLRGTMNSLKHNGIAAIITYHSIEDRTVKNFFKTGNIEGKPDTDLYGRTQSPFKILTKKPILPQEDEIRNNTRARSAKLRAARRILE